MLLLQVSATASGFCFAGDRSRASCILSKHHTNWATRSDQRRDFCYYFLYKLFTELENVLYYGFQKPEFETLLICGFLDLTHTPKQMEPFTKDKIPWNWRLHKFLRNSTDHSSPPNPLCPAPFCTLYTYKAPLHLIRPTQLSTVFRVLLFLDPRPHRGQCLQLQFSLVINPELLRLLCLDGVRKATKWTQDSLESLTPHGAFLLSHNEINKNCQFYLPCGAVVKIKRMDAYPSLKFAVKPNTNVPYSDLFLHNFISGLTQSL